MKAIIVYYSHSANNESLAREMKIRLGCDLLRIEEEKPRTGFTILLDLVFRRDAKIYNPGVMLDDYNMVVFIAPIWDAKIATPLKTFIKMEKGHIKNYAFITMCSGREGQHEKITSQLTQLTLKKPIIVTELKVKDLLPSEQKDKITYRTLYGMKTPDWQVFKKEIQHFVNTVYEFASDLNPKAPLMKEESFA